MITKGDFDPPPRQRHVQGSGEKRIHNEGDKDREENQPGPAPLAQHPGEKQHVQERRSDESDSAHKGQVGECEHGHQNHPAKVCALKRILQGE